MRLGLFAGAVHPPREDYQMLEEDLEAVIHADQLGFDDVWIGEHFSSMTEPITSPLTFLAKAIPLTKQIRLCTGVLNLPQQHPAVVARLRRDVRSPGRRPLPDGHRPGGLPSDFELFHLEDHMARGRITLRGRSTSSSRSGAASLCTTSRASSGRSPEGVALARAWSRRHAQALPAATSADRGRRHEPVSRSSSRRRRSVAGRRSAPTSSLRRASRPTGSGSARVAPGPASSPTASAGTWRAPCW